MINSLLKKMKTLNNEHPKRLYFYCFTFFFLITLGTFYFCFIQNQKGFIWIGETKDGLVQHYNSLMYFGSYLRGIVKNLLFNQTLSLPMWDFNIGYGADVLTSLHYYVIGDPLNLLSVFVPARYTEYLYMFLIVLRLYLAGISFSYFCFYMKKGKKATLIGALTYLFCGFVIFAAVRHPYFLNPMIYLPLILVGVEKIFNRKSPVLFIFMIFISGVSNFYFLFMLCLFTVFYAILRYFSIYKRIDFKLIFKLFCQFVLYALIGLMISAIILVPVISFFLSTSRSGDRGTIDLFYNSYYYISTFLNFNSYHYSGYWTVMSFSAISVLSIFMLYIKKKNNSLKLGFILMVLCLSFPIAGFIFNGLSYVSNRWAFGFSFVVGLIVCYTYEDLLNLTKKQAIVLFGCILIYIILSLSIDITSSLNAIISAGLMLSIFIVLLIKIRMDRNGDLHRNSIIISFLITCFVVSSVSVNAYFKFSPNEKKYINEFVKFGDGYKKIKNTRSKGIKQLKDNSYFRYDETCIGNTYLTNAALQQKQHSLSFFYSLGNGYITEYFQDMKNLNALSSIYTGLNYRRFLETLASVKYFIAEPDQEAYIPYGFNKKVYETKKYSIYKTDLFLPLGYTYNSQISESDYSKLTPIQKQQALMQGYITDNNNSLLNKTNLNFDDYDIPFNISKSEGIKLSGKSFDVLKKGAYLEIDFEDVIDSELYFSFNGFVMKPELDEKGSYKNEAVIDLKSEEVINTILMKNEYNTYYNGTEDFIVNLGYSNKSRNKITITFSSVGKYTCESMSMTGLKMQNLESYIDKLKENTFENVQIETNKVKGSINLDEDKYLCLSIPYSEGWTAYIDGKRSDLHRTNIMYMGLPIQKGTHDIELVYKTPFIDVGIICTGIGLISFTIIILLYRKKKQNEDS